MSRTQLSFSFGLAGLARAAIDRADAGDWARIVGPPFSGGHGYSAGGVSRVLRAHLDSGMLDTPDRRIACGAWVRELAALV